MKNRDSQHLSKLRDYYARYRVLPSYSSIANLLGLKSTSAVSAMVERMKLAGLLESGPDRRLRPGPSFFERTILESVQAGEPAAASAISKGEFNLDDYLIEVPSRTVLLAVKGDSMIDAGLLPGDTVIVRKSAPTKPGDIVVAIVDGDFTVKYLSYDKNGFYLTPANSAYQPISSARYTEMEVFGKVVGSFRKYG